MTENKLKTHGHNKSIVTSGIIGLATGVILCAISVVIVMPSMMIVTKESNLGFDETVSALEKSIVENGWVISTVSDMNKSLAKHGVEFTPRVKLIKLCKPEYAKSVLETDTFLH